MLRSLPSQKVIAERVEILRTARERTRGLLKFSEMPKSYAAIFELPMNGIFPLIHTIGMKFPIDIFFCDKDKMVRAKFLNIGNGKFVFPWSQAFGGCPYLVECAGCDSQNISEGDTLSWEAS